LVVLEQAFGGFSRNTESASQSREFRPIRAHPTCLDLRNLRLVDAGSACELSLAPSSSGTLLGESQHRGLVLDLSFLDGLLLRMHYADGGDEHRPSRWWAFDSYEIRGGFICPAQNATLRVYDPWQLWDRRRPVYEELFGLFEGWNVNFHPSDDAPWVGLKPTLTGDTRLKVVPEHKHNAIATWCARYGLLGLALHRITAVRLWPQWRDLQPHGVHQVQPHYVRVGAQWKVQYPDGYRKGAQAHEGSPVPRRHWDPRWSEPGVILEPVASAVLNDNDQALAAVFTNRPLSEWAHYFPRVPAHRERTYAYPDPLSVEFWEQYCEPLQEFLGAIMMLRRICEALLPRKDPRAKVPDEVVKERGRRLLNDLLRGTSPVLERDGGAFQRTVRFPSLLAVLAGMIFEDIAHVKRCATPECPRTVATGTGRIYCTESCRVSDTNRRFRRKEAERIACVLRLEGVPEPEHLAGQIADRLGSLRALGSDKPHARKTLERLVTGGLPPTLKPARVIAVLRRAADRPEPAAKKLLRRHRTTRKVTHRQQG